MHSVVETPMFANKAKAAGLTEEERLEITLAVSANPTMGDLIKGAGGARKVRFPARGKGKSGGYRVIHFYAAEDVPVFLLGIYAKGEKVNLTQAERNQLRTILGGLADAYREGVREKVVGMREC